MARQRTPSAFELFSTCPASTAESPEAYRRRVIEVARASEHQGCRGILVYTDNSTLDPWLVAQLVIEHTRTLCPLVAVQPVYMHPYSAAKMVASLGYLYGRQLYLNMVAGGFKNDLQALHDSTPHDRRYDRLVEYTMIIRQLLSSSDSVTYHGEFYQIDRLKMTPSLPAHLFPGIFVSGSSEAGQTAARQMGASAVEYPRPPGEYPERPSGEKLERGIRVGIITRPNADDAWAIAERRFPEDRTGQLTHQLAMKTSDSVWHHQLARLGEAPVSAENPYWLRPFQNYQTFCPYLVGSYAAVAHELARYRAAGYRQVILDIPPEEQELCHVNEAFALAAQSSSGE